MRAFIDAANNSGKDINVPTKTTVLAPKYRRQIVYGKLKTEIGKILRTLCERKGVEIIEAKACPDHIHMLLNIPPKYV